MIPPIATARTAIHTRTSIIDSMLSI